MTRTIFKGGKILSADKWLTQHALIIENKKIESILPIADCLNEIEAEEIILESHELLIPGFIDLHVHGANGADVMDGTTSALNTISDALAKEGVTGFLATTMTAAKNDIQQVMHSIAETKQLNTGILGVHLEGPFISSHKLGAQLGDHALLPDLSLVKEWQQLSGNAIKLLTLAPELQGATEFIAALTQLGIRVSCGHTDASYSETNDAITSGCTHATHLFNAMRGIEQREPGAAGALLLSENITAELIADNVHLHPAILDLAWRVKGKDKLVLVTDAMRAKCLGHGTYDLGGQEVQVNADKATLADGTLAGSVLTMPNAIKRFQQATNCLLEEAIQLATLNPAKTLGISDKKGTLEAGKDADCIVMDEHFNVQLTMRAGEVASISSLRGVQSHDEATS